jgi:acetoin utilization deacetylase AcuC-like enzyme
MRRIILEVPDQSDRREGLARSFDEEDRESRTQGPARVLADHGPDLVLYLAGADPYREDQLGGLALTIPGLRERDRTLLEMSREAGAAVAAVLAGGYALRTDDTIEIHTNTVREAKRAVG